MVFSLQLILSRTVRTTPRTVRGINYLGHMAGPPDLPRCHIWCSTQSLKAAIDNELQYPSQARYLKYYAICCTSNPFQIIHTLQVAAAYNCKCTLVQKQLVLVSIAITIEIIFHFLLSGLESQSSHPLLPIQEPLPCSLTSITLHQVPFQEGPPPPLTRYTQVQSCLNNNNNNNVF